MAAGLGEHAGLRARRTLGQSAVHPDRRPGVHRVAGAAAHRAHGAAHRTHRADGGRAPFRGPAAGVRGDRRRQLRAVFEAARAGERLRAAAGCRTRPARSIRCCARRPTNASPRSRAWRRAGTSAGGTDVRAVAPRRGQSRRAAAGPARARVDRCRLPRALDRAAGRQREGAGARLRPTSSAPLRCAAPRDASAPRSRRRCTWCRVTRLHRLSTAAPGRPFRRLPRRRVLHRRLLPRRDQRRAVAQLHHGHPARRHGVLHQRARRPRAWRAARSNERIMRIEDQPWTLRIAPTPAFVDSQKSALPLAGAGGRPAGRGAGGAVGALHPDLAAEVRASRKSLALNAGIISSSAHLVIAIDAAIPHHDLQPRRRAGAGLPAPRSRRAAAPSRSSSIRRTRGARAQPVGGARRAHVAVGPEIFTQHPAARRLREARVDFHPQGRLALPGERHRSRRCATRTARSRASSASSRTSPASRRSNA